MAMPPMPPESQGAPAPDEGPAEQSQDQGEQGQDPKQLLVDVHSGLAKVAQLAASAGAPPTVLKQLQVSLDSFRSAVEEMLNMKGGGDSGAAPAGQEMHSMAPSEVGGNPNARPM